MLIEVMVKTGDMTAAGEDKVLPGLMLALATQALGALLHDVVIAWDRRDRLHGRDQGIAATSLLLCLQHLNLIAGATSYSPDLRATHRSTPVTVDSRNRNLDPSKIPTTAASMLLLPQIQHLPVRVVELVSLAGSEQGQSHLRPRLDHEAALPHPRQLCHHHRLRRRNEHRRQVLLGAVVALQALSPASLQRLRRRVLRLTALAARAVSILAGCRISQLCHKCRQTSPPLLLAQLQSHPDPVAEDIDPRLRKAVCLPQVQLEDFLLPDHHLLGAACVVDALLSALSMVFFNLINRLHATQVVLLFADVEALVAVARSKAQRLNLRPLALHHHFLHSQCCHQAQSLDRTL